MGLPVALLAATAAMQAEMVVTLLGRLWRSPSSWGLPVLLLVAASIIFLATLVCFPDVLSIVFEGAADRGMTLLPELAFS